MSLLDECCKLLSKEVKPSQSIQELLKNNNLQNWVREGMQFHRGERSTCAFCGSVLPDELWDRIDSHFSKESEEHRTQLSHMKNRVDSEIEFFKAKIVIPTAHVYAQFSEQIDTQVNECNVLITKYISALNHLMAAIDFRLDNIFTSSAYEGQFEESQKLIRLQNDINNSVDDNNQITSKLGTEQEEAREALRIDCVQSFLNAIEHSTKLKEIDELKKELEETQKSAGRIKELLVRKKKEISILKNELSDERKGAAKVNSYLNHYFGHKALELSPEDGSEGSKFVLRRGGEFATNLSEGECSLVAFCYFMAKLCEVGSEVEDTIVWIDDPISSLDNNHIFFIFSLIESQLAKVKDYRQLFISTHNLDFLKYLKKLTAPTRTEGGKKYFILENDNQCSRILPMPKYLEEYTTEFNYLFDVIYKCSTQCAGDGQEFDYFYGFGNSLRRFLESFLFYKYPTNGNLTSKIDQFFDPDHESTALINRLVNEFSHLFDAVDRGTRPLDVPEMKKVADYVLRTIKERDEDQYNALMSSIKEA